MLLFFYILLSFLGASAAPVPVQTDIAVYAVISSTSAMAPLLSKGSVALDVSDTVAFLWLSKTGISSAYKATVNGLIVRGDIGVEWIYPSTLKFTCLPQHWEPSYTALQVCQSLADSFRVVDTSCAEHSSEGSWFSCTELHQMLHRARVSLNIPVADISAVDIYLLREVSHPSYAPTYAIVGQQNISTPSTLVDTSVDETFPIWVPSAYAGTGNVVNELGRIIRDSIGSVSPPALIPMRPTQLPGAQTVALSRIQEGISATHIETVGNWTKVRVRISASVFNMTRPPASQHISNYTKLVLSSTFYASKGPSVNPLALAVVSEQQPTVQPGSSLTPVGGPSTPAPLPTSVPNVAIEPVNAGSVNRPFALFLSAVVLMSLLALSCIVITSLIVCQRIAGVRAEFFDDDEDDFFNGDLVTVTRIRVCGDWAPRSPHEVEIDVLSDMTIIAVTVKASRMLGLKSVPPDGRLCTRVAVSPRQRLTVHIQGRRCAAQRRSRVAQARARHAALLWSQVPSGAHWWPRRRSIAAADRH